MFMNTIILRRLTASAAVCVLLATATACDSAETVSVESGPVDLSTVQTLPTTPPVTEQQQMTTQDLLRIGMEESLSLTTLSPYVGSAVNDTDYVYKVVNNEDGRLFTLTVSFDPTSGIATAANVSYGDTTVDLLSGDFSGAVRQIIRTEAMVIDMQNDLLNLDLTAPGALDNFSFTADDDTHRTYPVQNSDLAKTCDLKITFAEDGSITEALLIYGEVTADFKNESLSAVTKILNAMSE